MSPRWTGVDGVVDYYGGTYSKWQIYELARTCRLPHRKRPGGKVLMFDLAELALADDGAPLEIRRLAKGGRVVRPVLER